MATTYKIALIMIFTMGMGLNIYGGDFGKSGGRLFAIQTDKAYQTKVYEPVEWEFKGIKCEGNPFDVAVRAIVTHKDSGEKIKTELFYDGSGVFVLRFTATRAGEWDFVTESETAGLNGLKGILIAKANDGASGFVTNFGNKWGFSGTQEAFVPQFVMYADVTKFYKNPGRIDDDIQVFFEEHGFNGFHTMVFCRWFDFDKTSYEEIKSEDPNPDVRTFEALELLITKVSKAGGVVHIWAWGDQQRKFTPVKWGINGKVDKRLQRYICARLGPLTGWTMGYGFDLQEWVKPEELDEWHKYMQEHLGWKHYLGARAPEMTQIYDGLDYISYQQHRPTYETYVKGLEQYPGRPVLFEDRFRVRDVERYRSKDYSPEMTRRGLWQSTMAGGAGNIWGHLLPEREDGMSNVYPNRDQLLTWSKFFKKRFKKEMVRDNNLTDGFCLRDADRLYVFYKEDTNSIRMDLSGLLEPIEVVAVDTEKNYKEFKVMGIKAEANQVFKAPYKSDWALAAVRKPQPISSVVVTPQYITINERVMFLIGQMDSQITCTASVKELEKILDEMMVPYGMNLLVSNLGIIDWGGWNNLVNSQKRIENKRTGFEYPWQRTGKGETTFGGAKFDLEKFDEGYFDRLRARVKLMNDKGILPVVGIFSEHGIDAGLHWKGHPFHPQNNVNSLGLPEDEAIPEFFENKQALIYQEKYVRKLIETLNGTFYILYPLGEADRTPNEFISRYLKMFGEYEKKSGRELIVCLSGSSKIIEKFAKDPAVDLIDISYYHNGRYDEPELNLPDGELGIRNTILHVCEMFDKEQEAKPVVKFYFKHGYPYANVKSAWADKGTGTEGGGPVNAGNDAMKAVYGSGGAGIFFKMAWARGRGKYMQPDEWSSQIKLFLKEIKLYD